MPDVHPPPAGQRAKAEPGVEPGKNTLPLLIVRIQKLEASLESFERQVLTRLDGIDERLGEIVERMGRLPEDVLYCPRETVASFALRRKGTAEGAETKMLCEGGFRLRKHAPSYQKKTAAEAADDLYHALPPGGRFTATFEGLGVKQVNNHNVWRSVGLTAEAAVAAGLRLKEDLAVVADAAHPAPDAVAAAATDEPPDATTPPAQYLEWLAERWGTAEEPLTLDRCLKGHGQADWGDVLQVHGSWGKAAQALDGEWQAAVE